MARFYGTVQGGRGRASRVGHATTGLDVRAKSYSGDVEVRMLDYNGEDHVQIFVCEHGRVNGYTLYNRPIAALLDRPSLLALLVGEKLVDDAR